MIILKDSPIEVIQTSFLQKRGVRLLLKRDDLLHPEISGNKWRKLKFNLQRFQMSTAEKLLTFGGAFSNHIAAVAAAGKAYHFPAIGIIRGERMELLNPTLTFAESCGMQLKFISRKDYRRKNNSDFVADLKIEFGDFYTLPEGGSNALAVKGCREIITETAAQLPMLPDYFCVCCGTGGTIAGMIAELQGRSKILGFSALKGDFLPAEVTDLLKKSDSSVFENWEINTDYHFGGYAKWKSELIEFMNNFKQETGIALDPIYTGKMLYGIFDLIEQGYFEKGATILAVHTGGLQGIDGFNGRFGELIF
ncbi:MAG: 1-aminocyclopropane-1-carboxylate deaminase [Paraglaciecola sp.]|jgi:1-aminocyclopropane-1-carboxylate deaminase